MRYVALIKGKGDSRELEVEIQEVEADRYRLSFGGVTREVDARFLAGGGLSVLVGDESYDVATADEPSGGACLTVRGEEVKVEVVDVRTNRLRHLNRAHDNLAGPREVRSPMPGKIVAVLAKDGETVVEGQGLLVVEAMKMENELRAPKAGVVKRLVAQPGAVVEGNAVLCVVE